MRTNLLAPIIEGTALTGTVVDGAGYATHGDTPFPFDGYLNTGSKVE